MLFLVIGTVVLWVLWFLIGRAALAAARLPHDPELEIFESTVLLGAFVLAVSSQAVHFVVPLPSARSALVLAGTFALLSWIRHRDVSWLLKQTSRAIRRHPRTTSLFLLIVIIVTFAAARPCKVEDTENYHAQILRWTESARLVPGLALVHGRLGFNSLWFPLEAVLSFAFLSNGPMPLVNTSTFIVGLLFLFRESFATDRSRLRANFAVAALLPYVVLGFFYAGSQSPDLPALTYGLLCFFAVIQSFESNRTDHCLVAICLAVAAASWKLSAAPLVLFAPLLMGDRLATSRGRFDKGWVPVTIFLVLAGAILVTRSVVLSGYPFFPSTMFDVFPVGWKSPSIAHVQEIGIRLFARGLRTQNPEEAQTYTLLQWFPIWIRNRNNPARICLSLLAVGVALFPISLLFRSTRRWLSEANRRALIATGLVAVAASAFWFWQAPDVRFGASYLPALIALLYLPWLWPLSGRSKARHALSALVVVTATAAVTHNLIVGDPVPPWCSEEYRRLHPNRLYWLLPASYPEATFTEERLSDGSMNRVVASAGLAHYGAVPNSPLPIAGVAVRRGSRLADGYRVDDGK
jgi:hypothetical protein